MQTNNLPSRELDPSPLIPSLLASYVIEHLTGEHLTGVRLDAHYVLQYNAYPRAEKLTSRFGSLDDAKKQWTYRLKGEGGLATKVPNLNDECTTVWERLQEERRVWRTSRLLPWKDPYAVAADWFTIEQRQGGPGSRAKSGGEEGASRQGTGGGADWEHEVESGEEIEEEEEESEGGVAVDSDGSPVAPEPVTEDEMDVEMYDE